MLKFGLQRILGVATAFGLLGVLHAEPKPEAKSEEPSEATKIEEPVLSVTAHSVTVGGKVLKYHATAGYMVLREEEGKPLVPDAPRTAPGKDDDKAPKDGIKPKAKVFFVAYTLDDVTDPSTRPLTFCFNGGPGSASIWLHMGALAPRRAKLTDEGEAPPPPYEAVDNESTWLDKTDLVFIDPVSTGFSRTLPKEDPHQFHGLKEDIASIGDFIRLYTTRNARWISPKVILGESYGTTRAAGLSDYLQNRYGMYLNGIVLVSSTLNFQARSFVPQNNDPYVGFLPSYATTAWYHRKLPPDLEAKTVDQVANEARAFAGGDYLLALSKGDTLSAAEAQRIAGVLSRYTGFSRAYWLERKLRLRDFAFFTELLRSEGKLVGRYDSRFTGRSYEKDTDDFLDEYDPSFEATSGPMNAVFNDYVRRELKFQSDIPYEALTDVSPWNYGDAEAGFPNTADDLRKAMTRNPYLKVWVTCSYYDLATPFYAAETVIANLNLDPSVRGNLRFTYYESGHMLYVHKPSRIKFKADFDAFLHDALNQDPVHTTAR
jgi:carboxypeptidase C (cathepsin A)